MSIPPELQQDDIAAVIITSSRMAPEQIGRAHV